MSAVFLHAGHAVADERALQQALAKAQVMLKQTSAEKLAAEQELTKLKQEFEQYKKKAEGELAAREVGAERLAGNVNTLKERYVALAEKFQQLQIAHRNVVLGGKESEREIERAKQNFQLCFDNNKKLFDINQEILGNYQDKGFWDVLQQKEPFTGFASVKLETLIQEYQYQNEDLKLEDSLLSAHDLKQ
jgi:multidrug efflux pump subunit AcrA (membrane-fusion protein)